MSKLVVILHNHLSEKMSSLTAFDKLHDRILICETKDVFTDVKHHKKKLVYFISSMRHFAEILIKKGFKVHYIKLDDENNSNILTKEIKKYAVKIKAKHIVISAPDNHSLLLRLQGMGKELEQKIDILNDNSFLISTDEFNSWAANKKQLRLEFFYRFMRQKLNILMHKDKPIGGKWNYDHSNRASPERGLNPPITFKVQPDLITSEVISLVQSIFADHFGDIEPFFIAVTSTDAKLSLQKFVQERLFFFGKYQDAMIEGEPWMYHGHISFYLNNGLLTPKECIDAVLSAYDAGLAPLNAVEGFIRQILGWREFIRGIYWLKMPDYKERNFLAAERKLPEFFWHGKTTMNCIKQVVSETKANAYAHHIQRLMIIGNFALLAGLDPKAVSNWFLIVYMDALEWVELPNVYGMALYADGGVLATKPYAAGGSYIKKMSNYCDNCIYQVVEKNGAKACPFNYLYWDFLIRNNNKLSANHRLGMMYKTIQKMTTEKISAIKKDAELFLESLQ